MPTRTVRPASLVAAAMAALTLLTADAASAQDFRWSGRMAAGQVLEIRGVNGAVRALPASGDAAEVTAEKRARRDDPDEVEIRVVEHERGVTICAIYPTPRGERDNECEPGGGRNNTRNNDVKVDFTVRVPAGVRFEGNTVNGGIDAEGLRSDVELRTVNGGVNVSTTGFADAKTVNGSIRASVGGLDPQSDASFHTVNGSIVLLLPDGLNADVHAQTVNGGMETDFPLTISGRWGPRRLDGTLGSGGRDLNLKTVNGRIELRRQ